MIQNSTHAVSNSEKQLYQGVKMLLNAYMPSQEQTPTMNQAAEHETKDLNAMLVKIGKDKDKQAFITLFNHFAPRIKSFLIKAGLNNETADELAQETMLTLWNKAQSYDPKQAAASTWIFTIARNKRIDFLRKNGRAQFDTIENPGIASKLQDNSESAFDTTIHSQQSEKIAAAIEKLPLDQLALIKKSFFEDKSHAIIAKETGIPLGTVKSRIRLALERLRKETGVKELWN